MWLHNGCMCVENEYFFYSIQTWRNKSLLLPMLVLRSKRRGRPHYEIGLGKLFLRLAKCESVVGDKFAGKWEEFFCVATISKTENGSFIRWKKWNLSSFFHMVVSRWGRVQGDHETCVFFWKMVIRKVCGRYFAEFNRKCYYVVNFGEKLCLAFACDWIYKE